MTPGRRAALLVLAAGVSAAATGCRRSGDRAGVGASTGTNAGSSAGASAVASADASDGASERAAGPTPAVAGSSARDQHLVVGIGSDQTVLQSDRANLGTSSPQADICEPLTQMNTAFEVVPGLALRWELIPPNTWRFHLRQDVNFHDGSAFTSADVVWSLDRFARARGPGNLIDAAVGSAAAVDRHTVDYTPARPNAAIPGLMVHRSSAAMFKAGSDPGSRPIGTGPFRFVDYQSRRQLRTARFDGYWDASARARLAGMTWRYLPDADARILALKAGDIDVALDIPRDQVAALEADRSLRVHRSRPGSYQALSFLVHPHGEFRLTAQAAIREAVSLAIDRRLIVERVLAGQAAVVAHLDPPGVLGHHDQSIDGPRHDPAASRRVLDAAGWAPGADGIRSKQGQRLVLTLVNGFPSAEVHRPLPEVLQAQLREVGIALKIVEPASYDAALQERQGDLWLERGAYNVADPNFLVSLLYRSAAGGGGGAYARAFGIGGSVDELANRANAQSDEPERQQAAALAMKALIDEHRVVVPIAGLYGMAAARVGIAGLQLHSSSVHQRWNSVTKGPAA